MAGFEVKRPASFQIVKIVPFSRPASLGANRALHAFSEVEAGIVNAFGGFHGVENHLKIGETTYNVLSLSVTKDTNESPLDINFGGSLEHKWQTNIVDFIATIKLPHPLKAKIYGNDAISSELAEALDKHLERLYTHVAERLTSRLDILDGSTICALPKEAKVSEKLEGGTLDQSSKITEVIVAGKLLINIEKSKDREFPIP